MGPLSVTPNLPALTGSVLCAAAVGIAVLLLGNGPVRNSHPAKPLQCGAGAFLPKRGQTSAVTTTPSGLQFQTVTPGIGAMPTINDYALVAYKGSLTNGSVFDQNRQTAFPVAGVVSGFGEALIKMQKGGTYRICMPSELGYGAASPTPAIPANAVLRFEISLLDFKTAQEVAEIRRAAAEKPQ
jgi:FKBP-type peptidyl-prolyl cis-trans isomerase